MNGSPSSVITLGYGAWGSTGLVLTLGYGIGAAVAETPTPVWRARPRPETMRARERPDVARGRQQ
jgi:hypothetical protein